jgi:hypothetical protein
MYYIVKLDNINVRITDTRVTERTINVQNCKCAAEEVKGGVI